MNDDWDPITHDDNNQTFCYSINDDSWNILPQASYKDASGASIISLGDFIYMINLVYATGISTLKMLNTRVPMGV